MARSLAGGSWRGIKLWNVETGEDLGICLNRVMLRIEPDPSHFHRMVTTLVIGISRPLWRNIWSGYVVGCGNREKSDDTPRTYGKNFQHIVFVRRRDPRHWRERWSSVKLWDVKTGKTVHTYNGAGNFVAYGRPDGKTLASAGWRGIELWEVGNA